MPSTIGPPILHAAWTLGLFLIGLFVGTFATRCVARLPWQQSVLWPGPRCPSCRNPWSTIQRIPMLRWFVGRDCASCGEPVRPRRDAIIELSVASLCAVTYLSVVGLGHGFASPKLSTILLVGQFAILATILVTTAFIDYDHLIIPIPLSICGVALGLLFGTIFPEVRPEPMRAETWLGGLGHSALGALVGYGSIRILRSVASLIFRREAMGLGDADLMALIGAFLGWQIVVLTFPLASFLGLAQALTKFVRKLWKWWRGLKIRSSDRELPFGPYLGAGALILMLIWPRLWPGWASDQFEVLSFLAGLLRDAVVGGESRPVL